MTKSVLICVDDNPTVLKSLKTELKSTIGDSYLVEMADNGHEAIELTQELLEDDYEIPLIIADYLMPDLRGDEVLKQVHQLSPNTLKILLTGQASSEAIVNALRIKLNTASPLIAEHIEWAIEQHSSQKPS